MGGSGWILVVVVGLFFVGSIDFRIAVVAVVVVLLLDCRAIDYYLLPLVVVDLVDITDQTSEPAAAAVVTKMEADHHCCYPSVDVLAEAHHHREDRHASSQKEAAAVNDPSW